MDKKRLKKAIKRAKRHYINEKETLYKYLRDKTEFLIISDLNELTEYYGIIHEGLIMEVVDFYGESRVSNNALKKITHEILKEIGEDGSFSSRQYYKLGFSIENFISELIFLIIDNISKKRNISINNPTVGSYIKSRLCIVLKSEAYTISRFLYLAFMKQKENEEAGDE